MSADTKTTSTGYKHMHPRKTPPPIGKLTKAFWLWVHWDDHSGGITQGFQLNPGWYLCHATPTRRKEGQVTQVQLSEARYPDMQNHHHAHEQQHLRHVKFKRDHAKRPWMWHTQRPLSLTKMPGKQGMLDVHEGYTIPCTRIQDYKRPKRGG